MNAKNIKNKDNIKIKESKVVPLKEEPTEVKKEKEEKVIPASEPEKQPQRIMTESESNISDLVTETPAVFPEVTALTEKRASILSLPEECEEYHGKTYRFRWLARDGRLTARLRTGIFMLCTKINCPFIKKHRFKTHGAVEQGGMLLAFTTEQLAKVTEVIPAKKSADLVKHYTEDIHKQEGFYRPEDKGVNEESEEGIEMDMGI